MSSGVEKKPPAEKFKKVKVLNLIGKITDWKSNSCQHLFPDADGEQED